MRKILTIVAATAVMAGMAGTAMAKEGWYGRADVGYSFDGDTLEPSTGVTLPSDDEEETPVTPSGNSYDLDDNWMVSGGFGYGFTNGLRAEGELAYRNNDVSGTGDEAEAISVLANLYYDFNHNGRFVPYVGAGLGFASLDVGPYSDANWAWQGVAGVAVPLTPRLSLDVAYRHFQIEDLEIMNQDGDYKHDAVTVGLRWQFEKPVAAAAPAPTPAPTPTPPPQPTTPPPPPACPAANFVVYFEWDRSNLNDAALQTIDSAVRGALACNTTAAVVVGHTDTSGSTQYNMALSERRAAVVRDAMVARGLAASLVTTQARGEGDLARATRDGVREPLNRRTAVTITFH